MGDMELKPCPLCGSTNITCFAEYDGDSYDNVPIYRAVVGCLGCHEEGCDPSYDEEPCFGIEAYFPGSHPLLKDCEDPSDCELVLERHMAERWNRRAGSSCEQRRTRRTCHVESSHEEEGGWSGLLAFCALAPLVVAASAVAATVTWLGGRWSWCSRGA